MAQKTSPDSTPAGMPMVNQFHVGKMVGAAKHFASMARFTDAITPGATGYAADQWSVGERMTRAGEPSSAVLVWNGTHARTVLIGTKKVVLAAASNVLIATSGVPSNSIGADGDMAIDEGAGAYYVKSGGAWGSAVALVPSGNLAGASDLASIDLPTNNAPLAAALNTKSSILSPSSDITTAMTVTAAAHADRSVTRTGSGPITLVYSTAGASVGQVIAIKNKGSGDISMSGVSAGAGFSTVIPPNTVGAAEFDGTNWISLVNAIAGGLVLAVVTGTAIEGNTLTCTPVTGWTGTFQWTKDGANISGATGSTYLLAAGDGAHLIGCKFSPTGYATNALAAASPADTTKPTLSTATVQNANPDRIALVWSEAMSTTISPASAFAVSGGHVISAHTYVDATHSYLTLATAFVNGESAKTLAYTQPGSARMQDLAGNLLDNFSGATITNNVAVAAPTFTAQSAPAANTGSAYSYTYAATGATSFALLSGTLPTGLTLNTSTGVLSGTPTAAGTYTFVISASNAGGTTNSSSQSVVITMAPSGTLSAGSPTTSGNTNLTALTGVTAWKAARNGNLDFAYYKTGNNVLTPIIGTNLVQVPSSAFGGDVMSWTGTDASNNDGPVSAGDNSGFRFQLTGTDPAQDATLGFTAPADTTTRKVRFYYWNNYTDHTGSTITASLSDGSASPITVNVDAPGRTDNKYIEFTYKAASAGKTLNIAYKRIANETGTISFEAVTMGT